MGRNGSVSEVPTEFGPRCAPENRILSRLLRGRHARARERPSGEYVSGHLDQGERLAAGRATGVLGPRLTFPPTGSALRSSSTSSPIRVREGLSQWVEIKGALSHPAAACGWSRSNCAVARARSGEEPNAGTPRRSASRSGPARTPSRSRRGDSPEVRLVPSPVDLGRWRRPVSAGSDWPENAGFPYLGVTVSLPASSTSPERSKPYT